MDLVSLYRTLLDSGVTLTVPEKQPDREKWKTNKEVKKACRWDVICKHCGSPSLLFELTANLFSLTIFIIRQIFQLRESQNTICRTQDCQVGYSLMSRPTCAFDVDTFARGLLSVDWDLPGILRVFDLSEDWGFSSDFDLGSTLTRSTDLDLEFCLDLSEIMRGPEDVFDESLSVPSRNRCEKLARNEKRRLNYNKLNEPPLQKCQAFPKGAAISHIKQEVVARMWTEKSCKWIALFQNSRN